MADGPARTVGPDREWRWEEIRGRMEAASGLLSRQGSVSTRLTPAGTRVASVRFVEVVDGDRRQRSIYLGTDEVLILRARELIRQYREWGRWAREAEEAARFVSACGALLRRMPSTRSGGPARPGGVERPEGPTSGGPAWSKETAGAGQKASR